MNNLRDIITPSRGDWIRAGIRVVLRIACIALTFFTLHMLKPVMLQAHMNAMYNRIFEIDHYMIMIGIIYTLILIYDKNFYESIIETAKITMICNAFLIVGHIVLYLAITHTLPF